MRPALMTTLLAAVALGPLGCSHRATIAIADGTVVKGVIIRSDAERLHVDRGVEAPGRSVDGPGMLAVRHDAIADIDHPGDGAIIGGVALVVAGVVGFTLGGALGDLGHSGEYDDPPTRGEVLAPRVGSALVVSAGLLAVFWGSTARARSRGAAEPPER